MTGINGNNITTELPNDSFLLVDSTTPSVEISKIVKNFPNITVISFDHDSHKLLTSLGISHSISENYLKNYDYLDNIQSKIYEFSYWYKNPKITSFLNFSNVNYGNLLHEEALDLLVHFLKKFKEIQIIYHKFPNATYFATSMLYDIISSFTSAKKLSTPTNNVVFANEKVRYNIKVGNRHLMLFFSRKMYLRLKSFSEIFINSFFNPSKNSSSKYSLMVEFDTMRYRDIFFAASQSNTQILFYGRRRPAIWNFLSFNIFKKTKSKIITQYFLSDSLMNKKIDSDINKLNSKLNKLWENDIIFEQIFCYDNMEFWSSLKPTFRQLFENKINDIVYEINLTEKLFAKCKFSSVMVLSEIGFTEQIVVAQAKLHNIPVILLQMGLHYDTKEAYLMNYSQAVYPINADKYVVWGKIYLDDAELNGKIDSSKILCLGSPRFDSLMFNHIDNSDEYVLLATSGPQRESEHGISIRNIENYENTIKQICEIVKSHNKKLVLKLHPSWTELDVTKIVKNVDPTIEVITSGDISNLIRSCSVMICMGLSTAILEAQILQKPVISISTIDYKWGNPTIFSSNSCIITTIDNLHRILHKLDNDDFRNNIIDNGNKFLKNCLVNHKNASIKLLNYLDTL